LCKRTKQLLIVQSRPPQQPLSTNNGFCFFFSKKEVLPYLLPTQRRNAWVTEWFPETPLEQRKK